MLTLDDCRNLAVKLAPELAGCIQFFEHQPNWPRPDAADAYAVVGRFLPARELLESQGRWRGEWVPSIVFVAPPTVGVLLHELAHVLPARPAIVDRGEPEPSAEQRSQQEAVIAAVGTIDRSVPPWLGHGPRFTLRALALHYRAERLGLDVPLESLRICGAEYGLSMPRCYRDAASAWPAVWSAASFAEIIAEPLPEYFARLWRADVFNHFHNAALAAIEDES